MDKKKYSGYDEKRDHILQAALRLITEKGVSDTSISDVAAEAGVSKGAIFHYFSSKSELIFQVTDIYFSEITDRIFTEVAKLAREKEPAEILYQALMTVLGSETRAKLHIYLLQEALTNHPELLEPFRKKYREWNAMITGAVGEVLGGDESNAALGLILQSVIDGLTLQALLSLPMDGVRELSQELADRWMRGGPDSRSGRITRN